MKYTLANSTLRKAPHLNGSRILTIPQHTVVADGIITDDGLWTWAEWRGYKGWVYTALLEAIISRDDEIEQTEGVVYVPASIHQAGRAAQYISIDGKEKHNLCGQFCAAEIGVMGIVDFLQAWKADHALEYALHVGNDWGTGVSVLRGMLETIGRTGIVDFYAPLTDSVAGRLVSPARVGALLDEGRELTMGVNINAAGNIVATKAIGHWVNVVSIEPFGVFDGECEIYNPYFNQYQKVSWPLLYASAQKWAAVTGLWSE